MIQYYLIYLLILIFNNISPWKSLVRGQSRIYCILPSDNNTKTICWDSEKEIPLSTPFLINIAIGKYHMCALDIEHSLICSGDNQQGQSDPKVLNSKQEMITSGLLHSCAAIKAIINCWGQNQHGQNDISNQLPNVNIFSIEAGPQTTCVVYDNFTLQCYGDMKMNTYQSSTFSNKLESLNIKMGLQKTYCIFQDQVNNDKALIPNSELECFGSCLDNMCDVPILYKYGTSSVSVGYDHICAIKPNTIESYHFIQFAHCWGSNKQGQTVIPEELLTQTSSITAGDFNTCAIKVNGQFDCWGRIVFRPNSLLDQVSDVKLGQNHTCVIKNGIPSCFGHNGFKQLNIQEVRKIDETTTVELGMNQSCILKLNQMIQCSGLNEQGIMDTPFRSSHQRITQVSAGMFHACSVDRSGVPICWGSNSTKQSEIPLANVSLISAGGYHTCIKTNIQNGKILQFQIQCFGLNNLSQLDIEINPEFQYINEISAGNNHSCASLTDFKGKIVTCWGSNKQGQTTIPISRGQELANVSAGYDHTCAVFGQGNESFIECWGRVVNYQAWNAIHQMRKVEASAEHDCLVFNDGQFNCQGNNNQGQLGGQELTNN